MLRLKVAILDVFAGFVAFCLLMGTLALTTASFDTRQMLVIDALLFFSAGLLRSARSQMNTWLKALFVASLPVVIILFLNVTGNAFNDRVVAGMLVLVTAAMTISGVHCARFWSSGFRRAAVVVAVVPIALVLVIAVLFVPMLMARSMGKMVNDATPPFSITASDGSVIESAQMKGRVVVLTFWASWCAPCRQELPQLQKVFAQYRGQPDVEFWAVGGPWGEDTIERERQYAQKSGLTLPLAFDGERSASKAVGITGFPSLALLDKAGHLRFVHSGYDASDPFIRDLPGKIDALRGH